MMTPEEFGETYLASEQNIKKVLHSLHIYDEDLLHDTYIALYNHSQHAEIQDFVNTFVAFYRNLRKRWMKDNSYYDPYDNAQLAALEIIDESDWKQRERAEQQLDVVVRQYKNLRHLSGERNHQRACQILQLYRQGLTEREIAQKLSIDCAAVHRHLQRTIEKMRIIHKKRVSCKDKGQQELTTI